MQTTVCRAILVAPQAMASYTMAVGMFRAGAGAGDGGGGVGPMEGVAAEDMAAMQALLEEDENSPDAYAMAEDDSLDYDVRFGRLVSPPGSGGLNYNGTNEICLRGRARVRILADGIFFFNSGKYRCNTSSVP